MKSFSFVFTLLFSLTLFAQAPSNHVPAVNVEVVQVSRREVRDIIKTVGEVKSLQTSSVASDVPGKVKEILHREGANVRTGEALIILDDEIHSARYQEAEAALKLAKSQFDRGVRLHKDELIADSELAELTTALQKAKADEAVASLNLKHAKILAPYNGVISELHTEVGEWIDVGDAVVTLLKIDTVYVEATVPERDLPRIKVQMPAEIRVDVFEDRVFHGKIHRMIPRPVQGSRSYPVHIIVPNKKNELYPGMFARVDLVVRNKETALTVPEGALRNENGKTVLYVVRDDRAKRVEIREGVAENGQVEVTGDLSTSDVVVVSGVDALHDGSQVMIRK